MMDGACVLCSGTQLMDDYCEIHVVANPFLLAQCFDEALHRYMPRLCVKQQFPCHGLDSGMAQDCSV